MIQCPRCGVPNAPEQPFCVGCGYPLHGQAFSHRPEPARPRQDYVAPPAAAEPSAGLKGTMVGLAPEGPLTVQSYQLPGQAHAPAQPDPAQYGQNTGTPAQPPPPPMALKGTMLGMGS